MALTLPNPIAGYFAADNETDPDAVARHFTPEAIVRDEGHSHQGREAIRRWKSESASRYTYTAEPVVAVQDAQETVVTAHLTGDFPGSPVDLRYRFTLEGELISGLEIGA